MDKELDPRIDMCPAHPGWRQLSVRDQELWQLGYDWGQRDAEADAEYMAEQAKEEQEGQ